ncbi:hypothetical protein GLOTRDRAFT_94458 [Gloeophyllum trabeum ATCC 11539]|uniref:DUF6534 domain-containing protein n=1 Tax=Gloeophyllum trabeum (strain ATCC 11539 / FP-39264 / Madison 617) TaxID=670483 RepID=S7Q3G0_GLOTA|nr:uncharacterized protein GLOTRDRAFT_94458 [Gloeophyllum trabeum ATCC 11539]EPQ54087.1 hypothetical protein GLOTRDRAFT_94458 [Gloeophyllum trabeum ATCC 11539]
MDLTLTLGALYDGAVVSTVLYGLTCGQTYRYFKAYPDDKITLRIMATLYGSILFGNAMGIHLRILLPSGCHNSCGTLTIVPHGSCLTDLPFSSSPSSSSNVGQRKLTLLLWRALVILYIGACSTLLTDIGITFSMCSLLYQVRRSSLETSRSVLDTLFNYAMTTGLLVTIFTAVLMIVSSALPNTLLFDGLYLSAGKLYINSMLAAWVY